MNDWRANLIEDGEGIRTILQQTRRIAVLGIKTAEQGAQPAYWIPHYLQRAGYEIVPVPVYYPDATEILGEPVQRRLAEVSPPVDLVLVFRRSRDVASHVDDLLALRPAVVWMQTGIRHAEAAQRLAEAGIRVVQDRCAMVEHRMLGW